jgi:hypothetical protein
MKTSIRAALVSAGVCTLLIAEPAYAIEFQWGDISGSFDSTVTIGGGIRTKNPSCSIVGDSAACGGTADTAQWSAGDDGDLNYKKGDWFTQYVSGTHELLLKNTDGWKVFVRGTWKEDFAADKTRRTDLSNAAKDQIVNNTELLDSWVSKDFSLAGQNARLRVGNQVISWGEALFYIGGISNNVLDFQKLAVPGTQMKVAFLPVSAIDLSTSLTDTISGEAYYQLKFRRTRIAPVGSYFSASDIYGAGEVPASFSGTNFNVTGNDQYTITGSRQLTNQQAIDAINANGDFGVPILPDRLPKQNGEYGLALKWAPEGSRFNFGAYTTTYHDQFPVLNVVNDGAAYQWSFAQFRHMYGVTANFPVGNWAIGTELSYRPKDAITLGGCFGPDGPLDANTNNASPNCPLWKDNKKYQLSVTAMLQLQKSENPFVLGLLGADSAFLTIESAVTEYPGASKPYLRTVNGVEVKQVAAAGYFTALDTSDPANPIAQRIGTAMSWGFITDFNWTYDGKLLSGWQVTPGVTFSDSVKGDTPNFTAQFLEGNKSLNYYVLFNQNPVKWQAGINYTAYFGGSTTGVTRQYYKDRDFVGLFGSYNF